MDLVNRLSWLFGNEETVKYRRQSVLLREKILTKAHNINKGCECSVICSGSLGEGVAYPPSDDDLMYALGRQSMHVYDRYEEALNHRALYMIPSVYSPGFCILKATDRTSSGFLYVSSKEFREQFLQRMPRCYPHGPCASEVIGQFEYDYAKCLRCPRWPTVANEWMIRRRRYRWPSADLVEKIVRGGCHVVPIGNPNSPLCDIEWRVSFSLAERSLIHSFNHVQFLVYNLLKLVLKVIIGVRVPDVLCSYFLKTVVYYSIENNNPEIWVNDKIDECFRKCLLLLYHFINAKNCPSYFVPDNNMMRRKVNENNKLPLLQIISELMRCGIAELWFTDKNGVPFPRFPSLAQIELKCDRGLLRGYHLYAFMEDFDGFIQTLYGNGVHYIHAAYYVLSLLLSSYKHISRSTDSSFLNLIMKRALTTIGMQSVDISTNVTEGNKSRYQMLNYGQSMLKMGSTSDISSGKLQLAYYMFMTGRYRYCLAIVQSVLSKTPPYVIRLYRTNLTEMYMEVMCNTGHSIAYRVRKAWTLPVWFFSVRAQFAPFPIKLIYFLLKHSSLYSSERVRFNYLDPFVFAYYLQGLCFHQTRDFHPMTNSVTLMVESIKTEPEDQTDDKSRLWQTNRLLLGHIKMIQQDYPSSCRCFTSAFLITKDALDKKFEKDCLNVLQTCLILIACVLNRIFRTR